MVGLVGYSMQLNAGQSIPKMEDTPKSRLDEPKQLSVPRYVNVDPTQLPASMQKMNNDELYKVLSKRSRDVRKLIPRYYGNVNELIYHYAVASGTMRKDADNSIFYNRINTALPGPDNNEVSGIFNRWG